MAKRIQQDFILTIQREREREMANHGYCSNEQIIKSVLKRYKHQYDAFFTPFMMYLEEYIRCVQETEPKEQFNMFEVVTLAQFTWQHFKKCKRLRYKELADLANTQWLLA
ncbi:maker693 [Drosophila busckii]|uniref:Maker693 n=1 Tax=Drosophila busckii TaxID=30019 RepID=A0A0M5IYN7_DROBS|nr:maker693 [Drosophila busckii]